MVFPTVEVVYAPATDALKTGPDVNAVVAPTCDILKSSDGHIKTHYGIQSEDKSTAYMFVAWETLAHHHKLMNDTEVYPKLVKAIQDILNPSTLKMMHVACTSDPFPAFNAPVTELATFALQEGKSKAALEVLVQELSVAIGAAPKEAGAISPVWGPIVERENDLGLFIGWTSVDAHWALVKGDQPIADIINKIRELATIELVHIPLTGY